MNVTKCYTKRKHLGAARLPAQWWGPSAGSSVGHLTDVGALVGLLSGSFARMLPLVHWLGDLQGQGLFNGIAVLLETDGKDVH